MAVVCSLEQVKESEAGRHPIRYLEVAVPRFGTVRFRSLTSGELIDIAGEDNESILKLALVDDSGHRWVDDETMEYFQSDRFDGRVLTQLTSIALSHCVEEDIQQLVRDAAKNSSNGQTSLTPTA